MRTTLNIDADILKAAKVLAEAERKTLGQVLSELVRKGLSEASDGLRGGVGLSREVEVGRAAGGSEGRGQTLTANRQVGEPCGPHST